MANISQILYQECFLNIDGRKGSKKKIQIPLSSDTTSYLMY